MTLRSSINDTQRSQDYPEVIEEDELPVMIDVSRVTYNLAFADTGAEGEAILEILFTRSVQGNS